MIFEPRQWQLRDGRTCLMRPPLITDAAGMLQTLRAVSSQSSFLLRVPEECVETEQEEADFLTRMRDDSNRAMILAAVGGDIAGSALLSRHTRAKTRHRCDIGLALKKEYWHLGIGSSMMELLITLARGMGCLVMELECVQGNERALRLYERFGFFIFGQRPQGVRQPDGTFADEILMQKRL